MLRRTMALSRRSLIAQTLRNVFAAAKPAVARIPRASSPEFPSKTLTFNPPIWKGLGINKGTHRPILEGFCALHLRTLPHQNFEAFSVQQVRNVYVEVIDNDIDGALKIYKRKMNIAKIDDMLQKKRFYSKPSERRKLAKHYKKLNRARRELNAKVRTVKHRISKISEVRRLEREERKAKAAEAAAAAAAAAAKANSSQSAG